jgi:hypothetical protein
MRCSERLGISGADVSINIDGDEEGRTGSRANRARNPPGGAEFDLLVKHHLTPFGNTRTCSACVSPTRSSMVAHVPSSSRYRMRRGNNRKEKDQIQIQPAETETGKKTQRARPRPELHMAQTKINTPHANGKPSGYAARRSSSEETQRAPPRNVHHIGRRGPNPANITNKLHYSHSFTPSHPPQNSTPPALALTCAPSYPPQNRPQSRSQSKQTP